MSIAIKTVRNVSTVVSVSATVELGALPNLSVNSIDWTFGDIQIMWENYRQCEQQFIIFLNIGLSKSMEHSPLRNLRSPNQSRDISAFYETPSFIHGSYESSRRTSQGKKGKGLSQQAEVAQGVPGRLRPRIFLTFGTTRVVGRQPYTPAAFTPGQIPGTHFHRLSRTQGAWFCR